MIHLTIPTLGRLDKQITLNSIPSELHNQTYLVVQPHEATEANNKYGNTCKIIVLPENVKGLAATRKHIANVFKGKHHMQFDDDLTFTKIIVREDGKYDRPLATLEDWQEILATMEENASEYVQQGFATTQVMPVPEALNENARITMNVFYSDKFNPDLIKWGDDLSEGFAAEDFYATLQLLTTGHKNLLYNHFRVSGAATNAKGGCETYRTIDTHNKSMNQLQEKFPDFVRLRDKVQKTGPWAGQVKLAATIYWKKAYKSGSENKSGHQIDIGF